MSANVRFQKAIKGGRRHLSARAEKELKDAVKREARKFGVSQSFVVNTAVADVLGVDIEKYYVENLRRAKIYRIK